jgi:hypothetical protein
LAGRREGRLDDARWTYGFALGSDAETLGQVVTAPAGA